MQSAHAVLVLGFVAACSGTSASKREPAPIERTSEAAVASGTAASVEGATDDSKASAPSCDAVVAHLIGLGEPHGDADHQRRWSQHQKMENQLACTVKQWSPAHRACVVTATDRDGVAACKQAEYERSPYKQRCDSLATAMFDRTLAALKRDSAAAAKAHADTRDDIVPLQRVECATGSWTQDEMACLEAARTNDDDLECIGHHLFRKKPT